ncbi:hypothetical protein GEU84_000005 [Fertoebacter nigrum]|uniref:Uncharacterized protein n=1 Tax=Fertoeibacter niger TaxID=2656921 RepID=A0A8X8GR19_9RHOB|nr:hypothetical protein [Fertoeibacter niger]NUB42753.1 hypothetical protein [Fertoeibacter niger]
MDEEPTRIGARFGLSPEERAAVGRRLDEIAKEFDRKDLDRIGWQRAIKFPPPKNPLTPPGFVDRMLARRGFRKSGQ